MNDERNFCVRSARCLDQREWHPDAWTLVSILTSINARLCCLLKSGSCGASIAPERGLPSDQLYRTSNNEGHRVAVTLDTKVLIQGFVKTRTRGECAELFSLFSSFDGACQSGSFLIQRNRDKRSKRKFDVGVFTQPGSDSEVHSRNRRVRSTPMNRHSALGQSVPKSGQERTF